MNFNEELNHYIEVLECTGKELAEASGLSAAIISRYRVGNRLPGAGSDSLQQLAKGIAVIAKKKGRGCFSTEDVLRKLAASLGRNTANSDVFAENFNLLISALNININRLAHFMNYDASSISRIRTGQRKPADLFAFIDGVSRFVAINYKAEQEKETVASLLGKSTDALKNEIQYFSAVRQWLCTEKNEQPNDIKHFLNKLDEFNLNDFIRAIHFDELKVPTVPFQLSTTKNYIGLEQMTAGELDFFKATVFSKNTEPVFMCSDMDMEDLARDKEFGKKWMFAIAMCLKKGLHLHVIHAVDRPLHEMMLGLESWMPIYMTGQVSPYYLKNARSSVYQHLNYVSGAAALTGECIVGHHGMGKYTLTKKPEEIAYFRQKSEYILKKALPLMEIYGQERKREFLKFQTENAHAKGSRHGILSTPPIYTISEKLLSSIFVHNQVSESEKEKILAFISDCRKNMEVILQNNQVFDELPLISEDEFKKYPVHLSLEGMLYEKDIAYTYEQYLDHIKETSEFSKEHPNYTVNVGCSRAFRSIQIFVLTGEYAMISKDRAPAIHFVIRQKELREAIDRLMMPITEEV